MTRNPHAEAADLRQRLRDTETRLRLLAAAVVAHEPGVESLARLLLGPILEVDDVSQRPPSTEPREPEAGTPSQRME